MGSNNDTVMVTKGTKCARRIIFAGRTARSYVSRLPGVRRAGSRLPAVNARLDRFATNDISSRADTIEIVMSTQTVTCAVETDLEPVEIYNVLVEISNIPKWAPGFADAIERIDDTHYRVTKSGAPFDLELVLHQSAGTVDYMREMAENKRGGAYIRVVPRPLGGSTITMTVPIGPGGSESDVAETVKQELSALVHLVRR